MRRSTLRCNRVHKALAHDAYANVRDKVTVTVIPLFVPDVDENWLDYTVDGVDLERDWDEWRAPESKVWFDVWKKIRPDYAINLHQMSNWPFVEGTADICAFQAFANMLRPEEMSAEQWDTNRRIGALRRHGRLLLLDPFRGGRGEIPGCASRQVLEPPQSS